MSRPLIPDPRVEQADWYKAALAGFGGRVECVAPSGYPVYARILHPAKAPDGTRVTWAEVAAYTGRVLHPLAQFTSLAGRWEYDSREGIGWPGENPMEGTPDLDQLRLLCGLLADHTTISEHCWLIVREGWGNLPSEWERHAPRVMQPNRAYYLFERPLDEVVGFAVQVHNLPGNVPASGVLRRKAIQPSPDHKPAPPPCEDAPAWVQAPSQWWPSDRARCVATEIDFDSTIVGGSERLVDRILSDVRLEAFQVKPGDDLSVRGDLINPPPPR